jgi:hypothetical protein
MVKYKIIDGRFLPTDEKTLQVCKIDPFAMENMKNDISRMSIESKGFQKGEEGFKIEFYIPSKTPECRIPVSVILQVQASLAETFDYTFSDVYRAYTRRNDYLLQDETNKVVIIIEHYTMQGAYDLADYISEKISELAKVSVQYIITPAGSGSTNTQTAGQRIPE